MNRLLCPALLLVILSAGCRRPAEPAKSTGRATVRAHGNGAQLEVFSRSLTKDAIVFDYRLTNRLRGAMYFVCPDPTCSHDPEWGPQLPFYELNESSVLAVYGYRAREPYNQISEEQQMHKLMKVDPGDTFSGRVSLEAPFVTNRPYGGPVYPPETIWIPMIDRIRLTIGYFVCPGTETEPECSVPIDAEYARLDKENTSYYLDCGAGDWDVVPQHLISAEDGIGHTGEWLGKESLRGREDPMDAGRKQ